MSRAVNAIVIGVAVFVLLAGSIWYVMVAREPNRIKASVDREWHGGAGDNFTLVATFENPYDYEVILHRYDYEFLVNDEEFAGGGDQPEKTIPPRKSMNVQLNVPFPVDAVSAWFKSHVANDETSTVQLRGEAIFSLSDRNSTVPFGYKETFKTKIRAGLERADDCERARTVCFAGADAHWSQKNNAVLLVIDATLHNPTKQRADLGNNSLTLHWAGVEVAKAVTGGGTIEPSGDLDAQFLAFFEHAQLVKWWAAHTARCEESPSEALLTLDIAFEDPKDPEPSESPSPVSSSPTSSPTNTRNSSASQSPSPSSSSASPTPTRSSSTASPTTEPPPTDDPPANGTIRESQHVLALAEPLKPVRIEFDAVTTAFVCTPE